MSQFALPLAWAPDARDAEFIVSASNAQAVRTLEHWASWPVMTALLVGPPGSGRSLLATVFARMSGGQVIDDAERHQETELFHAWNRAQAERRPLLLVADAAPPEWAVRLPDLKSRLAASPVLRIEPPDDALVGDLLRYLFERRELDARDDLIAWLDKRLERTHLAVLRAVERLEEVADAKRTRRLSIPMARAAFAGGGYITTSSHTPARLAG